ncbi:MAG: glycosyltransferase family 2 protein [Bacilli bacterium]
MAKVSIIVPIYNVEKYLPKCLDSLINQTFKDIEIWAISDGSPDNSVSIVKEYSKKDKRIKCIEKENGGYGSVLEYAIQKITTEYFLICDPDDWLREDAVEILYKTATKNKVDLVVGSKYLVYNDNEEEVYDNSKLNYFDIEIDDGVVYNDMEKAFFLTPSPHSKLYKTSKAKKIKFPHKVSFTDFLLYTVYINNCKNFIYLEEGLSYYLVDRPGNSMTDINPRIFDYHMTVFKSIMEQMENCKNSSYYLRMFDQFRYVSNLVKDINDSNVKKEKRKQIYEMLLILQKYKREINECNSLYKSKKVREFNKLLFCKITRKYFYNRLTR